MAVTLNWLLEKANNKLNNKNMDKDVVEITREVIKEMFEKGIFVGVAQAYRSSHEQNLIFAQGRNTAQLRANGIYDIAGKPGPIVTRAKGGQSNHNFGVAVDLFRFSKHGDQAIFDRDEKFLEIAKAMKKRGMEWGGDWTSFEDNPHFQLYDRVSGKSKPKPKAEKPAEKPVAKPAPKPAEKPKAKPKAKAKPAGDGKAVVKYPGKPLAKGDKGQDVKRIQNALGVEPTGNFGPETQAKVKAYQDRKGLKADGVVGPATWNMLF